jgi:ATP-dependent Lon protease
MANPTETFPVLPLRQGVVLPGTRAQLPIGRPRSVAAFASLSPGDEIVLAAQIDPDVDSPMLADLHRIAVIGRVVEVERKAHGRLRALVEVDQRVELLDFHSIDPALRANVRRISEGKPDTETVELAEALRAHVKEMADGGGAPLGEDLAGRPGLLADRIANSLPVERERMVEALLELNVSRRVRSVVTWVREVRDMAHLRQQMRQEVRSKIDKQQRDALLREQIRTLQGQLESGDGDQSKKEQLIETIRALPLSDESREAVEAELRRLERMPDGHPESNVAMTWLELVAELPWDKRAESHDDINAVEARLNRDHHGLEDVKRRVLEHIAVLKLGGSSHGNVLCLSGPPGVGKTSLGKAIAEATGRPFARVALGGVRDEAALRGHRRTYVGAMPGRLISAIKRTGVKNPVILLDEIDKLARGWSGDPEAALLEILDPEQNHTFTDHYLDMEFDLSEVLFVVTANQIANLSAPLRDRLEIVELPGYTRSDKVAIAREHLLLRKLEENAVAEDAVEIEDETISLIVDGYTREAGVRQLGRALAKLARAVALEVARGRESDGPVVADEEYVRKVLGRRRHHDEVAARTAIPGVATGLAWTPVGGDILFVEVGRMPGKGQLQITGQLGDVMKESARAALSYVRSHAEDLGIDADFLDHDDVHVHVPAGGVPKDGPSAGVTIFAALASSLTGRRVRPDTAMTGECTLRGRVLPVGGIESKVLAAHRSGVRRVILPYRNEADLDDLPEDVREDMEFILVQDMSEVIEAALETEANDALDGIPHAGTHGSHAPDASSPGLELSKG